MSITLPHRNDSNIFYINKIASLLHKNISPTTNMCSSMKKLNRINTMFFLVIIFLSTQFNLFYLNQRYLPLISIVIKACVIQSGLLRGLIEIFVQLCLAEPKHKIFNSLKSLQYWKNVCQHASQLWSFFPYNDR